MSALYQKLLKIPQTGKIPEKIVLNRIALSVLVVLFCLVAMSTSAFAFFSSSVTAGTSVLQSAKYELEISFEEELLRENDAYLLYNPTEDIKEFSFTIKGSETNTASVGYAKIRAEGQEVREFYTQPIWSVPADGPTERTYCIEVAPGQTTKITIFTEWGSCSQTATPEGLLIAIELPPSQPVTEEQVTETPEPEPQPEPPAEPSVETPAETPTETPVETPTETPVETPAETPVETPTETPVETPAETPEESTEEVPADAEQEPSEPVEELPTEAPPVTE